MSEITLDKVKQVKSPQDRWALIPDVTPIFASQVIVSSHMVKNKLGLIEPSGGLMSVDQVVVASGPECKVKVGDWVRINVDMFPKSTRPGAHDIGNVTTVHPPIERIGNTDYLYITDRHIKFILRKKD